MKFGPLTKKLPSTFHFNGQSIIGVGSVSHKNGIGRQRKGSKFGKWWSTLKKFTKQLSPLDFILHPPLKERQCRIQKCVVDWKIENFNFLIPSSSPSSQTCQNQNKSSSPVSISSDIFSLGKEIHVESKWYLTLKSDQYGLSVFLHLKEYDGKNHFKKSITVSFLIHVVMDDDREEEGIFVSKHMCEVEFKPKSGGSSQPNQDDEGHGFFDLLSHSDLINPINNLISSLHLRLELYLSSPLYFWGGLKIGKNLMETNTFQNCIKIFKTESILSDPRFCEGDWEIGSKSTSFHIHPKYFKGYPKLEKLVKMEKNMTFLDIEETAAEKFGDEAVLALLSFLVGNFTKFRGDFESVVDILKISHFYNIPILMNDTWINVLAILRLENLPRLIVLAFEYKAPHFVTNYIHMLLLNFMWELRQLPNLHYWATHWPVPFVSLFFSKNFNEEDEAEDDNIIEMEKLTKNEFYFLEHFNLNYDTYKKISWTKSNFDVHNSSNNYRHVETCHNCVDECKKTRIFCQERLSIDYLAKVVSWNIFL